MCLLFTFLAILYLYTMCPDPVYSPAESSYPFLLKNNKKKTLFPPLSLGVQVACAVLQWTERALGPLDWSCCCEPSSVGDRACALCQSSWSPQLLSCCSCPPSQQVQSVLAAGMPTDVVGMLLCWHCSCPKFMGAAATSHPEASISRHSSSPSFSSYVPSGLLGALRLGELH